MKLSGTIIKLAAAVTLISPAFVIQGKNIQDAVSEADAIVIGSISTRLDSADHVAFDISVEQVLKGGRLPLSVHVEHPWQRRGLVYPSGPQVIMFSAHGIWFLRRSGDSSWDVLAVNGQDGIMPALFWPSSTEPVTATRGAANLSASDAVVAELKASVRAGGTVGNEFLNAVAGMDTPRVEATFADFLTSASTNTRAVGLIGLLQRNRPEAIGRLAELWPDIAADPESRSVAAALRDEFRNSDPNAVRQLANFAAIMASPHALRQPAIHALAAVHTRESLPFLASLLLSSDPGERMKGVYGLSSFANGCPAQIPANVKTGEYLQFRNPSAYRTSETIAAFAFGRGPAEQESELVSFWTNWWNKNKASLILDE